VYLIYGRRATRFIETLYSNIGQTFVLVVASSLLAAAAAAVAEAAGRYARVNSDALPARSAGQLVSWSAPCIADQHVCTFAYRTNAVAAVAAAAAALLSHPLLSVSTVQKAT